MSDPLNEFPRQLARTRGFTLGVPRAFTISPDGARVAYLRTRAGDDPVSCLWVFDVQTAEERLAFDPRSIQEGDEERLTPAELARRERARERSSGVTRYAADREVRLAAFALFGRLFLADLVEASARELSVPGPPDDPRPDPTGQRIAYVVGGALHVREIEGGNRVLAADDDPDTWWGLAEFNAAEEFDRHRGHWWSPDGTRLAAAHIDERDVLVWHIADPTDPGAEPRAVRYPAAGTANAVVTLHVFDVATGERIEIGWDREAFPYLARVVWGEGGPLTLLVLSRDQRRTQVLAADDRTGRVTLVREDVDPRWIDLYEDVPTRLSDGRLVSIAADHEADTNRLTVDGDPVTSPGLQVRGVSSADGGALFRASEEPTEIHLWRWTPEGGVVRLTDEPGVHAGIEEGEVLVRVSATADAPLATVAVIRGGEDIGAIANLAEEPVVRPAPRFLSLGARELRAALFLPGGREPEEPLPVVLDPYGGPHGARVLKGNGTHTTSQWLADHGFAVLVVDGRGVDGRGPVWDREMYRDFTVALDDQVDALHAAAERFGFLDLTRVGIRGWSFGGYLAAMAVLRRPDVFRAAVAGAPVTDLRLYDTGYTERYLGRPDEEPEAYERSSILADAPRLERPLLLIHGLSDDNVFVAHTLKLSAALFEAGRPHELVVLPNLTHLSRAEAVTEHVLQIQLEFLRRTLVA
ncbi:MAG TPA: prolyl oligopeptidase family serine peptidase [Actinomycetota bacterium]|nr:prolyl oligopeptidase family serine peptidase [Actinomycetota bacterium]